MKVKKNIVLSFAAVLLTISAFPPCPFLCPAGLSSSISRQLFQAKKNTPH